MVKLSSGKPIQVGSQEFILSAVGAGVGEPMRRRGPCGTSGRYWYESWSAGDGSAGRRRRFLRLQAPLWQRPPRAGTSQH